MFVDRIWDSKSFLGIILVSYSCYSSGSLGCERGIMGIIGNAISEGDESADI